PDKSARTTSRVQESAENVNSLEDRFDTAPGSKSREATNCGPSRRRPCVVSTRANGPLVVG
ncbi:MAG: hypothetical protein Q9157_009114, partial [Trypethelium eluteriae]